MKITLTRDDGTTVDITGLVQITYDVAVGSMDYSSGFLDQEELNGLTRLAVVCGFPSAREKVASLWIQRLFRGKTSHELAELANERGVTWAHEIQPTTEELDAFLEELKAGR